MSRGELLILVLRHSASIFCTSSVTCVVGRAVSFSLPSSWGIMIVSHVFVIAESMPPKSTVRPVFLCDIHMANRESN
ncbi:hypothetical protein BD414DRAFT_498465 [Trametes punicea]|nr:hypothetical protein BD414DRAFT_498465 [Trametes punicea]